MAALAIDIGHDDAGPATGAECRRCRRAGRGGERGDDRQATTAANQVVTANNAGGAAFQGAAVTLGAGGAVTVQGYVNAPLSFAPAVGYAPSSTDGLANTLSVPATATAALQNVCSLPPGSPIAPFGVIGDDPTNTDPAVAYVSALLSGAKTVTPGVYQPTSTQVVLSMNVWDSTGKLVVRGQFCPGSHQRQRRFLL